MPCRPFNLFSSNYIGGHLLEKTGPGKQVSNRSWSFLAKWIPSWGLWPSAYMTQRWSTMILGQINYLKWWAQITRQCNGQINWISHQYHQCPPVPLPPSGCFEEKDRRCPSRGHLRCWDLANHWVQLERNVATWLVWLSVLLFNFVVPGDDFKIGRGNLDMHVHWTYYHKLAADDELWLRLIPGPNATKHASATSRSKNRKLFS